MIPTDMIPDGTYEGSPRKCGIIVTTNGHEQFAIEVELKNVETRDGRFDTANITKKQGLGTEQSMGYAITDAENCGVDISIPDMGKWVIDPKVVVLCKVVRGEYGVELKSIYPNKPLPVGFIIDKYAIPEADRPAAMESINGRLAAVRKAKADAATLASGGTVADDAKVKAAQTKAEAARRAKAADTPI